MGFVQIILLIGGGCVLLGFFVGQAARKSSKSMRRTPTVTCDRIQPGAPLRCEVTGTATAGPGGALRAPFSGAPCVWYSVSAKVKAGYKSREDSETFENNVVSETSTEPFAVRDSTGWILVLPEHAYMRGELAMNFERTIPAAEVGALPTHPELHHRAVEYRYEEKILPIGQPLYLHGLAHHDGRQPIMRSPAGKRDEDDPYIISTEGEEQLLRRSRKAMLVGYGFATVAAVVSLALAGVVLVNDKGEECDYSVINCD